MSHDKKRALFTYMQLTSLDNFGPLVATFDGLDPHALYKVEVNLDLSANDFIQKVDPGWWPSVNLSGEVLASIGIQLPVLRPENGLLFEITAQ